MQLEELCIGYWVNSATKSECSNYPYCGQYSACFQEGRNSSRIDVQIQEHEDLSLEFSLYFKSKFCDLKDGVLHFT